MNHRILGKTGLSVSEIGFGGIPIQRVSLSEAVAVIKKAQSLGVNFIDTGVVYTDSEEKMLERALGENGALKALKEAQAAGKTGNQPSYFGFSGLNHTG